MAMDVLSVELGSRPCLIMLGRGTDLDNFRGVQ
jgi:hypothetical protein